MLETDSQAATGQNRRRLKYLLILSVLAVAVAAQLIYWQLTPRSKIRIASGPIHGQHREMMDALAAEIEAKTDFNVELVESQGSLNNIESLQQGEIDVALYQSGAQRMKADRDPQQTTNEIAFVGNLYSEVVHWIVRKDAGIDSTADLQGKTIAVGQPPSGDSAISKVLCDHYGLGEDDFTAVENNYEVVREMFEAGELDAAFMTVGTQADIFEPLSENNNLEFRSLENIDALVAGHISLTPYELPKGRYRSLRGQESPAERVKTVALKSQLLCRRDLPNSVVEKITQIALSEDFMRRQQLRELFDRGKDFARAKPEFAVHPGAEHYYDPELKPILNSNFVEAMEGMRSFLVSLLIAGYVAWRSWKKWNERQAEHRLDRYIRRLLEIERKQVTLGVSSDALQKDEERLRKLLDVVTDLRQDCLRDFTAHELNEDRSVDCFLEMCHALSDKINAKLLRVHLDQRFGQLAASLNENTGRKAQLPAGE